MAIPMNAEDWLLEADGVSLIVSWPEPGDSLHGNAHPHGPPRVSFGYAAPDGPQLEPLTGAQAWLADASGRRMRVRIERIDSDLKVVVGEVDPASVEQALPRKWRSRWFRRVRHG